MLRLNICISLLVIIGTVLTEDQVQQDEPPRMTGRLGFSALEQLRQSFCRSFCTSADTMPYLSNLICAMKCPELYLPHGTTTPESATTVPPQTTTTSGTTPLTGGTETSPTTMTTAGFTVTTSPTDSTTLSTTNSMPMTTTTVSPMMAS